MNMNAFVFSGQGSQYPGMGADLYEASPAARALYETASCVLGYSPLELTREQLSQTIYAQPAIVAMSLSIWEALQEKHKLAAAVCLAGFSLGEYSALAAANVLDPADLFLLVKERAELMQKAAEQRPGGMAAVIGLDDRVILDILEKPPFHEKVYAVNFNAPGQVVVSGLADILPDCLNALVDAGARRIVPLDVNGAFHTPFMKEAAEQLKRYAKQLNFRKACFSLYSNATAQKIPDTIDWPDYLAHHLCSPVRFVDEVRTIATDGAEAFYELGPGKVLTGLIRKILPGSQPFAAENVESLDRLCAILGHS